MQSGEMKGITVSLTYYDECSEMSGLTLDHFNSEVEDFSWWDLFWFSIGGFL